MTQNLKFRYSQTEVDDETLQRLKKEILSGQKPLGSEFYEFNHSNNDSELHQMLFDGHSTYLYEGADERPSIIVGRKGSGKSTYLHNLACKKRVIAIRIRNWTLMNEVQTIINILLNEGQDIRAERASYIWQWFMLAIAAMELKGKNISSSEIEDFLNFIPQGETESDRSDAITGYVSDQLKNLASGELQKDGLNCKSILWILEDRTSLIDRIEIEMNKLLTSIDKVAIIMFDNEELVLEKSKGTLGDSLQVAKEIAISGLLNLCGRSNVGATAIQIRYCIPAEQFFAFKELSKTVGKDFSNMHLLHWTVGELMSLIAHRYLLHLYAWKDENDSYKDLYDKLVKMNIYSREGAFELIQTILPEKITNGRGIPEDTMTYISRHFQVLPRQLLAAFNAMISNALKDKKLRQGFISENAVLASIRGEEIRMAEEILGAYIPRFPEAESIRKNVLPNMPLVFAYKDIRHFYDDKGLINNAKNILKAFNDKGVPVSPERFERCLIETGMVGRVEDAPGQDKQGYINVKYEYSIPGRLVVGEKDELAVHPLFSGDSVQRANEAYGPNVYGVYPIDTDPGLEPDRILIKQRFGIDH